ncbi:MAG: tyrosine-type recombinase/integrase [Deltaproteobacteria bacterium]|jgi:integrase|nr:tyrosine-type recombinase/integrase [Deltaproteobacteria bacterium]
MVKRTAEKLSEKAIQAAKPGPRPRKLADGHGLFLYLTPKDGRSWRYAFRFRGRAQTLTLGAWPEVSLRDAREAHAEARQLLAKGVNPAAAKREGTLSGRAGGPTFRELAEECLARLAPGLAPETVKERAARCARHLYPRLGDLPAASLRPRQILNALEPVIQAGRLPLVRQLIGLVGQVCRYGIAAGHDLIDPTAGLRGVVKVPAPEPRAAVTDPGRFGEMLARIEGYRGSDSVRAALRLLPYVFVRASELCHAEWGEIDFGKALWTIPKERMKAGREHRVPLSTQALAILEGQREAYGAGRWVFPSHASSGMPIRRESPLKALGALGYSGTAMTLHGFRSTASTLLNGLGYNPDWIERQLAHADRDRIRAAYNRGEYLAERTKMMQEWADHIDGLRAAALAAGEDQHG